jgi:Dehydrogenases with different specificities (related to short-chain alcohol dehydrogenases)
MNFKVKNADMFSVAGKTAVITGGAGGLGEAVCRAFADAGAYVAIIDVSEDGLKRVEANIGAQPGQAKYYKADVSKPEALERLMTELDADWDRYDILVNCAGINKRMPIFDFDQATMDAIWDINLKGLYNISRLVAQRMKETGGGRIINFGSFTAHQGLKYVSAYTASKCAVVGLTKVMAIEWAPYNILVNAVSPGFFVTPMNKATTSDENKTKWMLNNIALERLGMPEDVVGAVLFLAMPASGYITGINLFVDGGATAGGAGW